MSRVNFGAKPYLYPMPVLIIGTYDENGVPDAMNAAWGGISAVNEISISLSEHKTTKNFAKAKLVTIKKNSVTKSKIKGLAAKKKYYVRIRTYKNVKVNGKTTKIFSAWSKSKTVKTK